VCGGNETKCYINMCMCINMKHHNPYLTVQQTLLFCFSKMNVDWLAIKFCGNKELFNVQPKNNLTTIESFKFKTWMKFSKTLCPIVI
jgi:hypothetical protein